MRFLVTGWIEADEIPGSVPGVELLLLTTARENDEVFDINMHISSLREIAWEYQTEEE